MRETGRGNFTNLCMRVTVTCMAQKPVANALTLELEPVCEANMDRHLNTEDLWFAHDYVPVDDLPWAGHLSPATPHVLGAGGFAKWGMTNATAAARVLTAAITGS